MTTSGNMTNVYLIKVQKKKKKKRDIMQTYVHSFTITHISRQIFRQSLVAAARCLMCSRAHLTFRRVQPPGPATVLGVVVHKHVVGDGEDVAVHVDRGRHHHLGSKRQNFTNTKQSNVLRRMAQFVKSLSLSYFLMSVPSLYSEVFQS